MSGAVDNAAAYRLGRGVAIPMRDGVALSADVWTPEGEGPWPTLLQRLPYDRSNSFQAQHIAALEVVRAVDAGFAVVLQDTRGRYASGGSFAPFVHEAPDGEDTIAWLREQPFCDGTVGMYGASYNGATQLLAASRAPRGLRAIAPQLTGADYRDGWTYRGGALQLGFVLLWIVESLAPPDVARMEPGPERAAAERALAELQADPAAAFARLPLASPDLTLLAPYAAEWLRGPAPSRYWEEISPASRYGAFDVAALHVAGWHDIFLEGSLRNYVGLRSGAATAWARDHQHLVIGPWSHGNPSDWQGDRWHGYAGAIGALDPTAMQLELFAAALAGRPPELPRVRLFTTGVDRWREEDEWPLARARERVLHLRSDGDAAGAGGTLADAPPSGAEPPDRWISDPLDPVPSAGGATFLPGPLLGRNSGPKRQEAIEARADVLTYTSAPLPADLEVTGEVVLELHAASSASDCDWTARLVDVEPDGAAYGIVDGILRARWRHGWERPVALEPDRPELFRVVLGTISHVFRAGHRLRLQVASSNFPRFDRNPQQLVAVERATRADFRVARQTVLHTAERPSRLLLPVVECR